MSVARAGRSSVSRSDHRLLDYSRSMQQLTFIAAPPARVGRRARARAVERRRRARAADRGRDVRPRCGGDLGRAPLPGPFAFGHEFVADVIETGDAVTSVRAGDRVIVPFQVSCGIVRFVPSRSHRELRDGGRGRGLRDGADRAPGVGRRAERLRARSRTPTRCSCRLPPGLEPASVASVSDNVPDGWRAVAPELERRPGAPVLVVGGAGDVALYAVAVAVALGSEQVDYVDTDARRLAVAERLGAHAIERRGRRQPARPVPDHRRSQRRGRGPAQRVAIDRARRHVHVDRDLLRRPSPLPLLEMYTRGVTFRTGRVNARAGDPARARSDRRRPAPAGARDERDRAVGRRARALADLDAKTVVVRPGAERRPG